MPRKCSAVLARDLCEETVSAIDQFPRRAAMLTEVDPLQKAAVIPEIGITSGCGIAIWHGNPICQRASESTPQLIVRTRYMAVLALFDVVLHSGTTDSHGAIAFALAVLCSDGR